ncbi:hypothetical protein AB832_03245 [Flavobacteriaceae bacterium (ex Bugula neritina AB1)]|nr:hypothetical protein AB832_03245 [Flavobacteriaceae bacterium (ex Bugula neritina AB1)]
MSNILENKKTCIITKEKIFQNIVHFLVINSEGVDIVKNPISKTAIIYFLFNYAYKYKKQHYTDFAFDLLQQSLSEIVNLSQKEKDINPNSIWLGYGLMQFNNNGFFESYELDEILYSFDIISIRETERLSRGEFSTNNVYDLLSMANYLIDRMIYMGENTGYYLPVKEHLLIVLFELVHNMSVWNRESITWVVPMVLFLEKCREQKAMAKLAKKGLQEFENYTLLENEHILKRYKLMKSKEDLSRALLLWLNFSNKIKNMMNDKTLLKGVIEIQISNNMEQLYRNGDSDLSGIKNVIIYALTLIEDLKPNNPTFLTHLIINSIKN